MPLLLVEDDRELALGLANSLAQSGYETHVVHGGRAALDACLNIAYDLVILDLGLPDMDGLDVLRSLRKRTPAAAPILILTARFDVDARVQGLDAGGDDYLGKPFALSELEARIRALLRRGAPAASKFGDLSFDADSRQAEACGRELPLTARETLVLAALLRKPGRVVSKSQIMQAVYDAAEDPNPSMIEVFVSRLRRKLAHAGSRVHIRALRGLGYRLEQGADE